MTIFLKGGKKSDGWQKRLNWQCWAGLKKRPLFKSLLFFHEVILALHRKKVSIRVYATSRKLKSQFLIYGQLIYINMVEPCNSVW